MAQWKILLPFQSYMHFKMLSLVFATESKRGYLAIFQNRPFLQLNIITYNRTLDVAAVFNNNVVHHNRVDNLQQGR